MMNEYYAEEADELLTFDTAEKLVLQYLQEDTTRSVTRVKHVLNAYGYPYNNHNVKRVIRALKRHCEPYDPEKSGATRFRIPEEFQ